MARFVKLGDQYINVERIAYMQLGTYTNRRGEAEPAIRLSFGESFEGWVVRIDGEYVERFLDYLENHTDLYDVGDIPDETPKVDEPLFEEDLHEPDLPY